MAFFSDLLTEAKRPFNAFSLLLAVAGIVLAVFAWLDTVPKNHLSYDIGNSIKVYDGSLESENIRVEKSDGSEINNNLYAMEVALWNSSDVDLTSEQIRKPIVFELSNGVILDAKITKSNVPEVSKFSVKADCDGEVEVLKKQLFPLFWCVFDRGFGARMSVIYEAEGESDLTLCVAVYGRETSRMHQAA